MHHKWSRAKSNTKEKGKSFVGLPMRSLIRTEDGGDVLMRGWESRRRGEGKLWLVCKMNKSIK